MTTPAQPTAPSIPHSLTTHIVKAHLAFFDNSKNRFCSLNDYPELSNDDAILITKSLSEAGVKNETELKAAKASGYIVTFTSGTSVSALPEGKKNTQAPVSSSSHTDWSLTATTSYNLPADEKFWDTARDAIKGFHRALKSLFVPAVYTRANQYKRGKELKSTKTIRYDSKVWYPLSDVLAQYDTFLTKSKVGEEWQLLPTGVLAAESKLTAYLAVDETPLGSVTSATTLGTKNISNAKSMKQHLGKAIAKPAVAIAAPETTKEPTVTPKTAPVKSSTTTWSKNFSPFGTGSNAYVSGAPACTTYMDQIVVMWQSRESKNPLYFGIYAGDPNNGGDGLILGPTAVLDSSGATVTTTLTPTLITLDDTLHLIVGTQASSTSQMLVHYCFNRDLNAPRWILADTGNVGPTPNGTPPALGLVDGSTLMCMWVDASSVLDWAVWQQEPNWNPTDPNNENQAPPGKWTKGNSSVAVSGQTIKTNRSPALIMLNGKLAVSYPDSRSYVQLLAFSDLSSQTWTTFAPGLNPDPAAQGLIGGGYDDEYAIIAARWPGQQGIGSSIWRGGTWDAHSVNEASQDSVCAVILNRVAYIFYESTDGGPQFQMLCVYWDLTTVPYHPSSWMKDLITDRRLNIMAIPATHDTGTYGAPWLYKQFGIATQGMDLKSQLYAGVRAFDFRLDLDGETVIFVHGGWDVDLDFIDACDILYTFLYYQPNEVLIVCMKNDGSAADSDLFEAVDQDLYYDPDEIEPYGYWYGGYDENRNNDLPLLSEARGLIVLLRRFAFDLPPTFGVDFSGYSSGQAAAKFTASGALQGGDLNVVAQDVYQIGLSVGSSLWPGGTPVPDYNTKWKYIQNVLNTSAKDTSGTSSTLYVNFTSAACAVLGTGIPPPVGWDPSELAEGMSTLFGLVDYEGINTKTQRYFDQTTQGATHGHGLIYMDFPEDPDETITSIVEANTFN